MQRTRLSSNQLLIKSAFIFFMIILFTKSFNPFDIGTLLIGIVFTGVFFYSYFYLPDTVEFDDTNMYIIYRKGETEVSFKNIYYVTKASFGSSGFGKIKYHYEGSEYYARFYPKYFSSSFKKFTNHVKDQNPNAIINSSWIPF